MGVLIDSYSESNCDAVRDQDGVTNWVGQCFAGKTFLIESCKFYLDNGGIPASGNMTAELFNMTGTFGESGRPATAATSPIAVSDLVSASILTDVPALISFNFSGLNRYQLEEGTNYCIALHSDFDDVVFNGIDQTSPTHAGNYFEYNTEYQGGTWFMSTFEAVIFYVYGVSPLKGPMPVFLAE